MPGFNRKGPEGIGPMTGSGRGLCNSANRPVFNNGDSFMAGTGRGKGIGNCRRQSGAGRRAGFGNAEVYNYDKNQEKSMLRNEAAMLKNELNAIEKRLNEINGTD